MNATYSLLFKQAQALAAPEFGHISNMANAAALLYRALPQVNWLGFYILDGKTLRLGPFHGEPACTQIPLGRGVCGTAAAQNKTLIVPDVHQFEGHIACDSASQSEIVVPIVREGQVWAVLDVDSPVLNRFGPEEQELFEAVARLF